MAQHPGSDDSKHIRVEKITNQSESISGPLAGYDLCVIGAGFVGCVAAAGFAKFGHNVVCVENDPGRLNQLKNGELPFYEPQLKSLVKNMLESGNLRFSSDLESNIKNSKAFFITVGTPSRDDGRADLKQLEQTVKSLSGKLKSDQILVIKSTVPVGTADRLSNIFRNKGYDDTQVAIINNPEFLREGSAVYDFFYPNRIVIGGNDTGAIETIKQIYRMGMTNSVPIVLTNNKTAEMIKYASNVFLAMKIGFINEVSKLCDNERVDILEVAQAMGYDSRIGREFLNPGPGWGGSCLPKDLQEFIGLARSQDIDLHILQAVQESNLDQHRFVVTKILNLVEQLNNSKIALLGLSFKAGTNDLRNSPALAVIRLLIEQKAKIQAYDPAVFKDDPLLPDDISLFDSPYEAVRGTDCVVILTEWPEFQIIDWEKAAGLMKSQNIVDARNLLPSEVMRNLGFRYTSIGQI